MHHRTAFITGASSGIGRELALRLAREGVEVALGARREDVLLALVSEIREEGGRARAYPLDVCDAEQTTATIRRADQEMNGIDLVVANAGVGSHVWAGKLTYEACENVIAVNVCGAVATLTALLPAMVERDRGHLVGVSSLAQYRGLPRTAAYCASKAFLSNFLESLRVDLADTNVRVTDVRPGFIRTPLTDGSQLTMPFLMDLGDAVREILDGIRAKQAVVAFPWQLAHLVRVGQLFPPGVYDGAVRRIRRPKGRGEH